MPAFTPCPSCYAKRREEWGQWIREALLLDVLHRQVVLTIPKALQIFFKFRRRLLGELSRSAVKALSVYLEALAFLRLLLFLRPVEVFENAAEIRLKALDFLVPETAIVQIGHFPGDGLVCALKSAVFFRALD